MRIRLTLFNFKLKVHILRLMILSSANSLNYLLSAYCHHIIIIFSNTVSILSIHCLSFFSTFVLDYIGFLSCKHQPISVANTLLATVQHRTCNRSLIKIQDVHVIFLCRQCLYSALRLFVVCHV